MIRELLLFLLGLGIFMILGLGLEIIIMLTVVLLLGIMLVQLIEMKTYKSIWLGVNYEYK